MKIKIITLLFIIISSHTLLFAEGRKESANFFNKINHNITQQLERFPQEKIHAHIDKSYYVSGEKIWFRAYLVNASTHQPMLASRYIYAELINPLDTVVCRVKIRPENGMFYGHILLPEDLAEGTYSIRAYTNFMRNIGEEYFFRKNIRIGNPLSAKIKTDTRFEYEKDNKRVNLEISFTDISKQEKITPQNLYISRGFQNAKRYNADNGVVYAGFRTSSAGKSSVLFIQLEHNGLFYKQYITIPPPENDFDVSFFPEGGYLLADKECKIAFKALKTDGLSENITGIITDDAGNTITAIRSIHLGMGFFTIRAQQGKTYYVVCKNANGLEKRFQLPQAQTNGLTLKTSRVNNRLIVSVQKTEDAKITTPLYLIVHTRGIIQYAGEWDESWEYMAFQNNSFPSGVSQILLTDNNMNPLSERLVFFNNSDQARITVSTDKQEYRRREHVVSNLKITDEKGSPLAGNFSVSVTDNKDVQIDTNITILSTLLLTSELKGQIEDPGSYFSMDDKQAALALDALMMTQGWRRYNISDMLKGKPAEISYPLEAGQEISGEVKGLLSAKPFKKNKVNIVSTKLDYAQTLETDNKGHFYFNGFETPDSTDFIIKAHSKKDRNNVRLFLDEETFPVVTTNILPVYKERTGNKPHIFEDYIAKADQKCVMENGERPIMLSEAKIIAPKQKKGHSIYAPAATDIITTEDIETYKPAFTSDLFRTIPGIQIRNGRIYMRGSGTSTLSPSNNGATILIDGHFDITEREAIVAESHAGVNSVNVNDIASIEVYKGSTAAIFGSKGFGGVIIINIKKGEEFIKSTPVPYDHYNVQRISPLGYQKPVEFYSPKYETQAQKENAKPDLRTTIFWKPNTRITENGEATFDFYTADNPSSYSIVIEGVCNDGRLIRTVGKIDVN